MYHSVARVAARVAVAASAGFLASAPAPAQQSVPVDTALVLAVDASGSISTGEFQLQKEGIAEAIIHPRVLAAIAGGPIRRVAIAYVEWGGPGTAALVVDWTIVEDRAGAEAFAAALLSAERSPQSYNAIGDAIVLATAAIAACPCEPLQRVIDISGDNPDNRSLVPSPRARDAAVAAGITINALAILQDSSLGPGGRPWLVESYEAEVIGGPGAFVMPAASRADFTEALMDKLVLELSLAPDPAPPRSGKAARPY